MCRQVRIIYQSLKALRHVTELVNHIFSIPFRLRNIILQFYISQKLYALLIDFPELLIRVRAVRTSSVGEGWVVFCIGVPRILFLFERRANYSHDIWAVLSPWFSLLSRRLNQKNDTRSLWTDSHRHDSKLFVQVCSQCMIFDFTRWRSFDEPGKCCTVKPQTEWTSS